MRKNFLIFAVIAFVGLSAVSCSNTETMPTARPSATVSKTYELRGTVVSVDREEKEAVIAHEAIEGFMEAMRMGFSIPESVDLEKIHAGDKIKATLAVENSMMWLEQIEVLGSGPVPPNPSGEAAGHDHP